MDKETFRRLAAFNKLRFTPEEEQAYLNEIQARLKELAGLEEVPMTGDPVMVWPSTVAPIYREDEVLQTVTREEILAQAPEQAEHCFVVPRVAD